MFANDNFNTGRDTDGNRGNREIPIQFIVHMSHDLQLFLDVNRRLEAVVNKTNLQFGQKILKLEEWQETHRRQQVQIKQNFQKAKNVVLKIEEENAQLRSKITSLGIELALAKISLNSAEHDGDCDVTPQSGDENSSPVVTEEVVRNLRKDLKDVKTLLKRTTTERDELKRRCEQLNEENHKIEVQYRESFEIDKAKLVEDHEKILAEHVKEYGICQEKLATGCGRIEELQDLVTRLFNENKSFMDTIQKNGNRIKTLESEMKNEKEESRRKCDENRGLRQKIEEKHATIRKLGIDLETCRHRHGIEIQNHQSEKDELYARLVCSEDSLNKRHENFLLFKQQAQSEKDELMARINSKDEDITFFKQQLNTYTQDFAIEREEATRLREQLDNHRRLLQEKEQMLLRLTTPSSDHNP